MMAESKAETAHQTKPEEPMSHASTAAKVRERKEAKPALYCSHPRCLWSLSSGACPKHTDVLVEDHGSIVLIRPLRETATVWLVSHTEGTWFGHALAVEPRYVADLVAGLEEEGFTVGGRR
jgi:hypothetical protein